MTHPHRFDPTILREYDVRGIVGETVTSEDAWALGRAFGTVIARRGGGRAFTAYDGRASSPELEEAVTRGLTEAGVAVSRAGLGPTPMLYFAARSHETEGAIMVTGSHNPPGYNGFKFMLEGRAFFGQDIAGLAKIAANGDFASGAASDETRRVFDDYLDALTAAHGGARRLRVAWDAGNGAAGEVVAALAARLPGHHIVLNARIDGSFPNHHPDPSVAANLVQLQAAVDAEGCDLGIAFDGDGDRIGVVDGRGRILWGDQILAVLAREVLAENPGATVIADVKSSQALFDEIARLGGRPLMWRTGHSLIKSKMAEVGAPLAGEMTGHIFFADRYYGFDDALYAAVRLLRQLASGDENLDAIRDSLPRYFNTPEIRIPCEEARKFALVDEVRARLEDHGAAINDIDGIRVTTADGWWLLRASNTQAVLVARCEARDEAGLAALEAALGAALKASGLRLPVTAGGGD